MEELSQNPNDTFDDDLEDDDDENQDDDGDIEHETGPPRNEDERTKINEGTLNDGEKDIENQTENPTVESLDIQHEQEQTSDIHDEMTPITDVSTSKETNITSNPPAVEKQTQSKYNLRPNRTPNYLRRFAFLSVKSGIKKWGEKAREAVRDKLRMFIKERVFKGLRKPMKAQMERALMIHCFIIEKRDRRIKARAVADGKMQQRYTEEETNSPTVRLESLMMSCMIDAFEK